MLLAYRVTAGQEAIVADLLYEKIKKTSMPISAVVVSPRLKGYLIVESDNEVEARRIITNVPHVKGALHRSMKIEDLGELLAAKAPEILLEKGQLVEITSGPFKGEKAKVKSIDQEKGEIVVELVEVAVPIPVTIKIGTVKAIPQ
jgi:transcriptional antiterminator NusG